LRSVARGARRCGRIVDIGSAGGIGGLSCRSPHCCASAGGVAPLAKSDAACILGQAISSNARLAQQNMSLEPGAGFH